MKALSRQRSRKQESSDGNNLKTETHDIYTEGVN